MKKLVLITLLSIIANLASSQNTPDFYLQKGIKGGRNYMILKVTPELVEKLNEEPDKSKVGIYFSDQYEQSDFDTLCISLPWIQDLYLKLSDNSFIENLDAIVHLKALKKLTLYGIRKGISLDLKPLAQIDSLNFFSIKGIKTSNEQALENHVALTTLDLSVYGISSLDFLYQMPQLEKLVLRGSDSFNDYGSLAGLRNLKELEIRWNDSATDEKLKSLKQLTSLKKILLANNDNMTSLDFLENCKDLEVLNAGSCDRLSNFSVLTNLVKLKELNAEDTQLEDLNCLSKNINLENLYLKNSYVTDISPLKNNLNLLRLGISDTEIDDISVLFESKSIMQLYVSPSFLIDQVNELIEKKNVFVQYIDY